MENKEIEKAISVLVKSHKELLGKSTELEKQLKDVLEREIKLAKQFEELEQYIQVLRDNNFGYDENYKKTQFLELKTVWIVVLFVFIIWIAIKIML